MKLKSPFITIYENIHPHCHHLPDSSHQRDVDGECYNVLGQRISQYTKGLVIYKGKKYLNR